MRPGAGKSKGNAFELEICKKLSLWVSDGLRRDIFVRSTLSGGVATQKSGDGDAFHAMAGDISSILPQGSPLLSKVFIECKHIKNAELLAFFLKDSGMTARFWVKAAKQSEAWGKDLWLIVKQNHTNTLLITKHPLLSEEFSKEFALLYCTVPDRVTVRDRYVYDLESFLRIPYNYFATEYQLPLCELKEV